MSWLSDLFGSNDTQYPITKENMEKQIKCFDKLISIFSTSQELIATGGGRSEKMASVTLTYKSVFAYVYENKFKYGKGIQFFDTDSTKGHYIMISNGLESPQYHNIMRGLPSNWNDLMVTVNIMKTIPGDKEKLSAISNTIDEITSSIKILSTL